jgi:hypothetical protein
VFNFLGKKIIRVDFCSIAKKLKFEIMHQCHAHPSFEILTKVAGMKRSGNTARHNTPLRILN